MSDWAKCGKAMLLINLKSGASADSFRKFFASNQCGDTLSLAQAETEKAILLGESEMATVPHQMLMRESPKPFAAMFQLRSPSVDDKDQLADGVAIVVEQLSDWIDRSRSALIVGSEVMITQGWGPIKIGMILRRCPEQTHDVFMQHWFGRHAALGEAVEGVRYRQNHVDFTATNRLAATTGIEFDEIDGVTESFFLSPEEAFSTMTRHEVAIDAIADEKKFIDHSRSHFGFYRILG